METVAVKRCRTYEEECLLPRLQGLLDLLGGIRKLVAPGQKVLLKVNLLMGKDPAAAVTTHPLLVKCMTKLLQEAGGRVVIGDSPGGLFTEKRLKKAYQKSGLLSVARETGAELNYNTDQVRVEFPGGKIVNHFILAEYITEADVVINLPKLKTHGLTKYTGAVKNLFGAIPGLLKGEYHLKMQQLSTFTALLVDLTRFLAPEVSILDAVTGMEGEGPSGGEPRNFGYLMGAADPFALDVAAARLLGLKLNDIPLIKEINKQNLLSNISSINYSGDKLIPAEDVRTPSIPRESNLLDRDLPGFLSRLLQFLLRPRPVFVYDNCQGCGECITDCPADTIEMIEGYPRVELDNCIRCFCCQEVCPHEAVRIKRPVLGKLLFR